MIKLEYTITLPATAEKLIEIATDYENLTQFTPQLKSVKVLNRKENEVLTEEIISTDIIIRHLRHEVIQQSIHKKIHPNKLQTTIVSGPVKDSVIEMSYENINNSTKISIKADIKISLKYKFLSSLIKNYYKVAIPAILYRMNNKAMSVTK